MNWRGAHVVGQDGECGCCWSMASWQTLQIKPQKHQALKKRPGFMSQVSRATPRLWGMKLARTKQKNGSGAGQGHRRQAAMKQADKPMSKPTIQFGASGTRGAEHQEEDTDASSRKRRSRPWLRQWRSSSSNDAQHNAVNTRFGSGQRQCGRDVPAGSSGRATPQLNALADDATSGSSARAAIER